MKHIKATPMTPTEIKRWMPRMGFDRIEACEALGINPSTMCRWLQGQSTVPGHVRLACAYLEGQKK